MEVEENNQIKVDTSSVTQTPKASEKEEDKLEPGKIKPNAGHGSSTDVYSWTQHDIKEININIPVAKNLKGRDFIVKYDAKELLIQIKGQSDPLVKGQFCAQIKPDSLIWTIDEVGNGKAMIISFEKYDTYKWWECLIKGEQVIDTTKINPEPSKLSDIEDNDMRSQVEKMMFDTRQKSQGLPTSDELEKNKMLEKFMKAHPEMDFSKTKFN
jgi:hypothetical protein